MHVHVWWPPTSPPRRHSDARTSRWRAGWGELHPRDHGAPAGLQRCTLGSTGTIRDHRLATGPRARPPSSSRQHAADHGSPGRRERRVGMSTRRRRHRRSIECRRSAPELEAAGSGHRPSPTSQLNVPRRRAKVRRTVRLERPERLAAVQLADRHTSQRLGALAVLHTGSDRADSSNSTRSEDRSVTCRVNRSRKREVSPPLGRQ